jgi:hypothetical protein
MSTLYEVVPQPGGRWELRQRNGAHTLFEDKAAAVTAAVELARAAAPGVVRVHGLDGRVESEELVDRTPRTDR